MIRDYPGTTMVRDYPRTISWVIAWATIIGVMAGGATEALAAVVR